MPIRHLLSPILRRFCTTTQPSPKESRSLRTSQSVARSSSSIREDQDDEVVEGGQSELSESTDKKTVENKANLANEAFVPTTTTSSTNDDEDGVDDKRGRGERPSQEALPVTPSSAFKDNLDKSQDLQRLPFLKNQHLRHRHSDRLSHHHRTTSRSPSKKVSDIGNIVTRSSSNPEASLSMDEARKRMMSWKKTTGMRKSSTRVAT